VDGRRKSSLEGAFGIFIYRAYDAHMSVLPEPGYSLDARGALVIVGSGGGGGVAVPSQPSTQHRGILYSTEPRDFWHTSLPDLWNGVRSMQFSANASSI
jgi:hypothetical protein